MILLILNLIATLQYDEFINAKINELIALENTFNNL